MYGLCYLDYSENIININPDNIEIDQIPIIKLIRCFVENIGIKEGIKLTKIGNLSPQIVKDLYSKRILKDYAIENGITKLSKETDWDVLVLVHIVCELCGLIKKRNNILTLTKKALDIVNSIDLFPLILITFCKKFKWSFFDGFKNEDIGQFGYNYSIYLLSKYGNEKRNVDFYAKKYFTAFPDLMTEEIMGNYEYGSYYCYSVRTFEHFLEYFGFVELTKESFEITNIQKTKLFDLYIKL
jgi:hypothetical protein